jgi:hypothetical protein
MMHIGLQLGTSVAKVLMYLYFLWYKSKQRSKREGCLQLASEVLKGMKLSVQLPTQVTTHSDVQRIADCWFQYSVCHCMNGSPKF